MHPLVREVSDKQKKRQVVDAKSGDIVRVHQRIREGGKSRVQVFEGLIVRTDRKNSLTSRITVRRIASGVGVEKSFLLHSPLVEKVEVTKRSKVRRNNLSYMRQRTGKSARLAGIPFDKDSVNTIEEQQEAAAPAEVNPDAAPKNEAGTTTKTSNDNKDPKSKDTKDQTKEEKSAGVDLKDKK